MRQFLILLLILCSTGLFADSIEISRKNSTQNRIDKTVSDTIIVIHSDIRKSNYKEKQDNNMPWIVALTIGVLSAIINIIIAVIQQKSNRRNIDRQLESAKETIQEQIKNSKDIAILDFNRSVKSQNRQEWINKLRDLISEIDMNLTLIAYSSREKTAQRVMEIDLLKNKIDLMLNQSESEHETLFKFLITYVAEATRSDIMSATRHKELREQCFNAAKIVLKKEWERVKKGE
jgi:hypothetical protein